MTTLYIDRKNTRLKIESGTLVCFINDQRQRPIPLLLMDRVIISCAIELSSTVLLKLAESNIAVVFLNPRNSKQHATISAPLGKNPHIRLAHYKAQADPSFCLTIATQWVKTKIKNQTRLLIQYQTSRTDLRYPLTKAVSQLKQSLHSLKTVESLESLRGIEGNAARISFHAYSEILPDSLGFNGRKRRPPPDPVNACLSLAYTLLHNRATQAAIAKGFDPMLGFLHEPVLYSPETRTSKMQPIYLDGSVVNRIRLEHDSLKVISEHKADVWLPLSRISRLILSGHLQLSSKVLAACLSHNIPIITIEQAMRLQINKLWHRFYEVQHEQE